MHDSCDPNRGLHDGTPDPLTAPCAFFSLGPVQNAITLGSPLKMPHRTILFVAIFLITVQGSPGLAVAAPATFGLPAINDVVMSVSVQSDGKLLLAGRLTFV